MVHDLFRIDEFQKCSNYNYCSQCILARFLESYVLWAAKAGQHLSGEHYEIKKAEQVLPGGTDARHNRQPMDIIDLAGFNS